MPIQKSKAPEAPIPLPTELPILPVPVKDFLKYVEQNPAVPVRKLLEPFIQYESALRAYFAQEPDHKFVEGNVNLISVFEGNNADLLKVRARNLAEESKEEKEKYIMPLDDDERKDSGDRILVGSLEEFRQNFSVFSEGALLNLDWTNIVAAGSSVMTPLLKVSPVHAESKKTLRKYYHELLAPASDIDLFIHGITDPEEAIKKMQAIEETIQGNLLWETTTIRTRNTVTIVSEYPNRHVQIVLRLYKSPSQILTGFDVPCSCFAYDGKSVFSNPRGLASAITQCNDIDLTRRSPSYENRLSKYSHRGFEVYCSFLDRTRIDPSIFERSFARTVGLARLLVLEALPRPEDRDNYVAQRRAEMGRPIKYVNNRWTDHRDIKSRVTDEVAEWDFEDVSGYQKFSIPYGQGYNAKRIEKLFFKKDLLLNAEWNPANNPPNRTVNLHRHPVFFGNVKDIVVDCCGFCPKPEGEEEEKAFEEEDKIYVSGAITFMEDDPGRQEIGSFYPLGPEDYTEMAYVGSTGQLCEAIVDNDVAYVKSWCAQEGVDLNCRDFCGRTPLQLACLSTSTEFEIVKTLVDAGARLVARMQDGRTALHLAAARGRADMVKVLLSKSAENEHERDEKAERRKEANKAAGIAEKKGETQAGTRDETQDEEMKDGDEEEVGSEDGSYDNMSDADSTKAGTTTTGGFVKIKPKDPEADLIDGIEEEEDDIYDVDVNDWDNVMSPLHHAIVAGHEDVVDLLVSEFGADVLMPMKIFNSGRATSAVLTLALALKINDIKRKAQMAERLLKLGASSAQGNSFTNTSAFHYVVQNGCIEILDKMFEFDEPNVQSVIENIGNGRNSNYCTNATPLITAIMASRKLVNYLLDHGALGGILIESFIHILNDRERAIPEDQMRKNFGRAIMQPIEVALLYEHNCDIIERLIAMGAYQNTITQATWCRVNYNGEMPVEGQTILDWLRQKIKKCERFLNEEVKKEAEFKERVIFGPEVLDAFEEGSYKRFCAEQQLRHENKHRKIHNQRKPEPIVEQDIIATQRKKEVVQNLLVKLEEIEKMLTGIGAKTYHQLFPDKLEIYLKQQEDERQRRAQYAVYEHKSTGVEEGKPDTDHIFTPRTSFNAPYLGKGDIQQAYLELFEAIWRGTPEDANIVKRLTLSTNGEGDDELPALRISITDENGWSTLWIALYRRNWDMAKLILAIVQEQYKVPEESSQEKHFTLGVGDDDDSDVSGDEIQMQVVDTAFTVENMGVREDMVKCNMSPFMWLRQSMHKVTLLRKEATKVLAADTLRDDYRDWTPLSYAIFKNDMELVRFILNLAEETKEDGARVLVDADADNSNHLELCLKLGRIEVLEVLMETVVFGIPFAQLEETDEEFQMQKPKFYQGLTVYGTKRKDWASSSYPAYGTTNDRTHKPIQVAVYHGQLDSIKWLLSERPFECLKSYMQTNPASMRVKLLKNQGDGLGFLLQKGLGVETKLLPHLAIKGFNKNYPMETFRFLLSRPGALEARNNLTMNLPLFAVHAFHEQKVPVLEELRKPEYEADFSTRDSRGRNIIHHALLACGDGEEGVKRLQMILDLMPEKVLETAWTQRMFRTSQTPLATWLSEQRGNIHIPMLRLILKYSKGKELGIANGEGNLPIHWFYQRGFDGAARIISEMAPHYIHSENANGRTPIEIATSQYLIRIRQYPPQGPGGSGITYLSDVDKGIGSFYTDEAELRPTKVLALKSGSESDDVNVDEDEMEVDDEKQEVEEPKDGITWEWDRPDVSDMYQIAVKTEEKYPGKRKLVSLADANELAKRITSGVNNCVNDEFDGGDILTLWSYAEKR